MNKMLRQWNVAVVFALIVSAATAARAQQKNDWSSLDQFIHSSMESWKVPGAAVAIVHGQSVVYMKGFGVRDIRTGEPVTPDTLFDIGSCTKAFTSAAVAMLVDEGKMRWDGRVRDYVPFFHLYDPLADEYVTMRDLLSHRTGVPGTDLLWYGAPYTREEIVRRMKYAKPNAGFRARFQYQNVMFVVAGYAVGQVTGGTWDQFVERRIFDPLGMTESDTSAVQAQRSSNFADPHRQKPDGSVIKIPWRNIDDAGPAGSINSSVRDMSKWITFQLHDGVYEGKRLVSAKNMREMHTPQMVIQPEGEIPEVFFPDAKLLSYGLGWFIEDYRGHELILHPGDIDGFSAMVVLIPDLDTGYVVLVNLGNMYRQVLSYHIADELLGLPEIDWSARYRKLRAQLETESQKQIASWESKRKRGTHPTLPLAAYAGTYDNQLYGHAEIAVDAGKLVLRFHGSSAPLEHFQYDTFISDLGLIGKNRLTFALDADGSAAQFTIAGIKFRRAGKTASASR
ncbi:MAG: serine hydrolase [Acidobacteriota bacterium]|nr:serine hydrolase [Acidobacteriota bacterium]